MSHYVANHYRLFPIAYGDARQLHATCVQHGRPVSAQPEPSQVAAIGIARYLSGMVGIGRKIASATLSAAGTGTAIGVGEMIISGPAMRVYAKGASFPTGQTDAATQEHIAKAAHRHEIVLTAIRKILTIDSLHNFRHASGAKAGQPNASKLADFYVESDTMNAPLGFKSVRDIISKAVRDGILE